MENRLKCLFTWPTPSLLYKSRTCGDIISLSVNTLKKTSSLMIPEELRNQAISKQNLVSSPAWWLEVFQHSPNWKNNLINATKELAKRKGLKPMSNLVDALERGRDCTGIDGCKVEAPYFAYESLLRGRR